jgi:gentisate 1,2-dioxygenase
MQRLHPASDIATLDDLYRELPGHALAPLWRMQGALTPQPVTRMVPHVWRWEDVRPLIARAGDLISAQDADRRVLAYVNPGTPEHELGRATDTLWAAVQLVLPGEVAPPHRHTPAALRFIVEGHDGYTVVDGDRLPMEVGDLTLTPNWTWHEHGNAGDAPMLWLDGLDVPMLASLRAVFAEFGEPIAAAPPPARKATRSIRTGELLPRHGSSEPDARVLTYRFEDAMASLDALRDDEGSPYDDLLLEYRNPLTNGPVLPTMSAYLQLLRPETHTRAHRHTASVVYHVAEGAGHSIVDGTRLDWTKGDTFAVPVWAPHEHVNESSSDAVLFSFSDAPALEALGLLRTQDG